MDNNLEKLAFIFYLESWLDHNDEDEYLSTMPEQDIEKFWERWKKEWRGIDGQDHYGDCTNVPMSCLRCNYDEFYEKAKIIWDLPN